MQHFTASVHQKAYKSTAQSIKNLNGVPLLTADRAELFQDMGHFLDKGYVLVMSLGMVGRRLLWLNISSFPHQNEQVYNPSWDKGLFGEAVTSMQQASDL